MRNRPWWLLTLLFETLIGPAFAEEWVIRNVAVVDVERGGLVQAQTVVVKDGRIHAVGSGASIRASDSARVVDGEGAFLLPALWDMHFHPWRVEDLTLFVANGIGGARIMAGAPEHLAWRARIELGELLGPRLLIAGPIIEGPPPPELANVVDTDDRRLIKSAAEARAEVRRQKAAGFDYIKVYNNLPADAYRAIADEARREHMPVVGHVPFQVGLAGVLEARQASIEHLRGYVERLVPDGSPIQPGVDLRSRVLAWEYADPARMPELARLTLKAGAWQCPTLSTRLYHSPQADIESYLAMPEAEFLTQGNRAMLLNRHEVKWLSNFSAADFQRAGLGDARQDLFVRELHSAGVPLLAGTDLGPAGFSLHGELERLVDAGLSPHEVLRSATLSPARFARLEEEVGRIAAGYSADFILLDANPLEHIRNTRKIRAVIVRGRYLDRAALDELLSKVKMQYAGKPGAAETD